ncbi:uncharacterized protein LOC134819394 [Bolinopsis microptera]|uniref:uncharacterized protein LOC134819394 n=1 Tax=Bolinopsis microptera TaxID=2820187 RepID=UPI00307A8740
MGCNSSKDEPAIAPEEVSKQQRRSTVQISIGQNIAGILANQSSKNIVFFGGPKSGKGAVIEELVESFGVKVISAESLLHIALQKTLSTSGKDGSKLETAAMLSQLKTQPSLVTLEWIFELIKTEVLRYPDIVHVIDLLPNSKIILRDKTLFDNAAELLQKFEETCPVAFAMHLYIDKEHLNKQLDSAATLKTPEGCTAPGGINDEADSAVTKKRHALYEEALKPVQKYFRESDRLVEVDVSSMSHERIWFKVVRMFASFDLSERKNNNLIVIFVDDASKVQSLIDSKVRLIKLVDIVDEPDAEFDLMMECLLYQITELGCPHVCYAVDIKGSTLEKAETQETKKCLVYELKEPSKLSAHLNKYQKNMLSEEDGATSKSWDDNDYICYKAPNNLTLLFSENFDNKRAEVIATSYCSMDKM